MTTEYGKGVKIDESSFRDTAEALMVMNPACSERGETVESLISMMQAHAWIESKNGAKATYVGTYGFHVTVYMLSYTTPEGYTAGAAANVSAFTANQFAKRLVALASGKKGV